MRSPLIRPLVWTNRLIAALCLLAAVGGAAASDRPKPLRVCPDAWIVNRMPTVTKDGRPAAPEQYYVLGGIRREIREFDQAWVRRNCRLTPENVW